MAPVRRSGAIRWNLVRLSPGTLKLTASEYESGDLFDVDSRVGSWRWSPPARLPDEANGSRLSRRLLPKLRGGL